MSGRPRPTRPSRLSQGVPGHSSPSVVTANEWLAPATTCTTSSASRDRIACGVCRCVSSPCPSWPPAPSPHENTDPSRARASARLLPAVMARMGLRLRAAINRGFSSESDVPCPTSRNRADADTSESGDDLGLRLVVLVPVPQPAVAAGAPCPHAPCCVEREGVDEAGLHRHHPHVLQAVDTAGDGFSLRLARKGPAVAELAHAALAPREAFPRLRHRKGEGDPGCDGTYSDAGQRRDGRGHVDGAGGDVLLGELAVAEQPRRRIAVHVPLRPARQQLARRGDEKGVRHAGRDGPAAQLHPPPLEVQQLLHAAVARADVGRMLRQRVPALHRAQPQRDLNHRVQLPAGARERAKVAHLAVFQDVGHNLSRRLEQQRGSGHLCGCAARATRHRHQNPGHATLAAAGLRRRALLRADVACLLL
eukprot:scaffold21592_cov125-Isochrysis_galbana.AAC.5